MAEKQTVIAAGPLYYPADAGKEKDGNHKRGAKIQMNASDVDAHVKLGLVIVSGESAEEVVSGESGEQVQGLEALKALWSVKIPPTEYLKRYENGPHATLALQIITAEADAFEAAEAGGEASTGGSDPLITTKSIPSPE